jgi:hypothetical protein
MSCIQITGITAGIILSLLCEKDESSGRLSFQVGKGAKTKYHYTWRYLVKAKTLALQA